MNSLNTQEQLLQLQIFDVLKKESYSEKKKKRRD